MKHKYNLIFVVSLLFAMIAGCSETKSEPDRQNAKVLAENLESPSAIISDEKFIYFVTGGHLASLKAGTSGVWKMSLAGGQPISLVKGFQKDSNTVFLPETFVLGTDEKYVYFSAGYIYRISKDGGEPEQIAAGTPTEMVLDDENIYWHNFVGEGMSPTPAYYVGKKGGEVKVLTDAATILDIAVDKSNFYWAQPDGIYRKPKKGGDKTLVYSPKNNGRITSMIYAGDFLYFVDNKVLYQISTANGGEPIKIISDINDVYKFYADDKNIYFVRNEGSFGTSLNKVSVKGGDAAKIDSGYIKSFGVGKDKIYVTDATKIYELEK